MRQDPRSDIWNIQIVTFPMLVFHFLPGIDLGGEDQGGTLPQSPSRCDSCIPKAIFILPPRILLLPLKDAMYFGWFL
jgi:hypothetical protein